MAKSRIRNQKKAKKVTRTRVQTRRNSQSKIRGKKQSKNRNAPRTKKTRRRNNKRGGAPPEDDDLDFYKQFFINYIPVDGNSSDIITFIKGVAKSYYGPTYDVSKGTDITLKGFRDSEFENCKTKKTPRRSFVKPEPLQIRLGNEDTDWETRITCNDTEYSITLKGNDESYKHPDTRFNYDIIVKKKTTDEIIYRFKAPPQFLPPPSQFAAPTPQLPPPPQGFKASTRKFAQAVAAEVKETGL